jgi:hypothetical protein
MTDNQSLLFQYDPEIKRQSPQWKTLVSEPEKNANAKM